MRAMTLQLTQSYFIQHASFGVPSQAIVHFGTPFRPALLCNAGTGDDFAIAAGAGGAPIAPSGSMSGRTDGSDGTKDASGFYYELKRSHDLTEYEIEKTHDLIVTMFPAFREYYERNRYYSSVKPQMIMSVWDGQAKENLVASGKLLWRDLDLDPPVGKVKLFVFGYLVYDAYQKMGVGTRMLEIYLEEAKKKRADLLFGSTANPVAISMLEKHGFRTFATTLTWEDAMSREIVDVTAAGYTPYVYAFREGIVEDFNSLPSVHLGVGPL